MSPPLRWGNPPVQTRSLEIACDDPDAPSGVLAPYLDLPGEAARVELDLAMVGHVFAEGMLIARYQR